MSQHLNMLVIPGSSPFQPLFITEKYFCLAHLNRKSLFSWVGLKKAKKAEKSFSSQPLSKSTKEILQRTPKDLKKNWWLIIIVQHKAANQPVSEEQMGYIKQAYSFVLPDSHN